MTHTIQKKCLIAATRDMEYIARQTMERFNNNGTSWKITYSPEEALEYFTIIQPNVVFVLNCELTKRVINGHKQKELFLELRKLVTNGQRLICCGSTFINIRSKEYKILKVQYPEYTLFSNIEQAYKELGI